MWSTISLISDTLCLSMNQASNLKSFSFAIFLHAFVVLFLLVFNKTHSNLNNLNKNIKLIRLVSFGSGYGNGKAISSKANPALKNISQKTTSIPLDKSSAININNTNAVTSKMTSATTVAGTGVGHGNGIGVGTGNDIAGGINANQASALEIEVNRLRVYLQKYLDSKLDSKNINFNIQLTLTKSSGVTNIEVLTEQLSSKQIYLIKKIIGSYQHQELINHLPSSQMNILIPIKII